MLLLISVSNNKTALASICLCPDALKKTEGFTPVKADVVKTILYDEEFWPHISQVLKVVKPLVDAIGNLESRNINLADCMLELIRCAHTMHDLKLDPETDDATFLAHSREPFSSILCAESWQLAKLPMWKWSADEAKKLKQDIEDYYLGRAPFNGGKANGLDWWRKLPISSKDHPLKKMAIIILSIVPHSAEVERLFSLLGGTQSAKQVNLTVRTFKNLGKLRGNYAYHIYMALIAMGTPERCKHAHMHTCDGMVIDVDTLESLEFTWVPPLGGQTDGAFDELEKELQKEARDADPFNHLADCINGAVYDFRELSRVEQGLVPEGIEDVIEIGGSSDGGTWNMDEILGAQRS
ncbi:hypothetical protein C8J56DRAFT_1052524 [Mycena floridula]|nr:hypothetical protein C8J56DRAFT_1052524 [Mycena floridula]